MAEQERTVSLDDMRTPHAVYPDGSPCNPNCPGPWSQYHDGYADGYEAALAQRDREGTMLTCRGCGDYIADEYWHEVCAYSKSITPEDRIVNTEVRDTPRTPRTPTGRAVAAAYPRTLDMVLGIEAEAAASPAPDLAEQERTVSLDELRDKILNLQARWMLSEGDAADARCDAYDDVLDLIDAALAQRDREGKP